MYRLCCIALMAVAVVLWEIHLLHSLKRAQMQFTALSPCQPNTGKSISMRPGTEICVVCSFQKILSTPTLNLPSPVIC